MSKREPDERANNNSTVKCYVTNQLFLVHIFWQRKEEIVALSDAVEGHPFMGDFQSYHTELIRLDFGD